MNGPSSGLLRAACAPLLGAWSIALLSCAVPARAQSAAEPWRAEVDRLVDRWTDDAGGERLARARAILRERLNVMPTDTDASLDLARVELASGRPEDVDDALRVAEATAGQLESLERRGAVRAPGAPVPPEMVELRDRRAAALTVAFLAAARAGLKPVAGDEAATRARMTQQAQALRDRRGAIVQLVGEEGADRSIQAEGARQVQLAGLDKIGQPARPLGTLDQDGQPIDFTAFRGQVVLVVFWTRDLGDPGELLDQIEAARLESGAEHPLQVISVCLDKDVPAAKAWVASHGWAAWRHLFASDTGGDPATARVGLLSRDAAAWGVTTVPAGFLLDHTGRVRFVDPWEPSLSLAVRELGERRDRSVAEAERRSR